SRRRPISAQALRLGGESAPRRQRDVAAEIGCAAEDDLRTEIAIQKAVELRVADVRAERDGVVAPEERDGVRNLNSVVHSRLRKQKGINADRTEGRDDQLTDRAEVVFDCVGLAVAAGRKNAKTIARQP